jgi:hypothetical protein
MKTKKRRALTVLLTALAVIVGTLGSATAADFSRPLVLKAAAYDLDLKFDFEAEKLMAECRLTVVNPSAAPVERIPLILYRLLKVLSVTGDGGKALPFTQRIEACEDWDRLQLNYIEVSPDRPVPAGGSESIVLKYDGYLAGYEDSGMLYVKDHIKRDFTIFREDSLAYPQIGVPRWETNRAAGLPSFDYLLTVTVPEGLVAANGGRLVGAESKDGKTVYSYRNLKPAWRMDVAIAPYKIAQDEETGLRAFHFSGETDDAAASVILGASKGALRLFSSLFFPLKGDRGFTIIEVPEGYGSQNDVTTILLTRNAFLDKTRLTDLYHEIAHFWDTRPLDPAPSRVESEGIAMLLQYVAKEKLEGDAGAVDRGAEKVRESFRKSCQANPKAAGVPIIDYGKADLTDLAYTKGMLFFYMIYKGAGEKSFLDALGRARAKFVATGAGTKEFLDSLAGFLKPDLSKLYRDWIYGSASSQALLSQTPLPDIVRSYFQ